MGWDDIQQLSATDQARAIKLLFDATDGARFVFGRIPIGASDYALDALHARRDGERLHDDELLDRPGQTQLIPYVKAALAVNPTSACGPARGRRRPG